MVVELYVKLWLYLSVAKKRRWTAKLNMSPSNDVNNQQNQATEPLVMTKLLVLKNPLKIPLPGWQMQSTQPPVHVYCYPEYV